MKSQLVKRIQPQNLQDAHIELFNRSAFYEVRNPSVIKLSNVYIFWQGQVFRKSEIYPESISTELFLSKYGNLFFFKGLISACLRGKLLRVDVPCLIIHDEWSMNYFHWLTDALSRLYLVKEMVDGLTIIIPESFKNDYHLYTLKRFGISKILYTNPRTLIYAKSLILPAHTAPAGNYHPQILRNAVKLLTDTEFSTIQAWDKIYISRSRATVRKIVNESEVQNCLEKMGFRILSMEELSFMEEIGIMRRAKILVSIHGAGLTNLIFMQPGSCILELRKESPSEIYNSYFSLCSVFGILYYYLSCNSTDNLSMRDSNIHVDLTQLEKTCRLMSEKLNEV